MCRYSTRVKWFSKLYPRQSRKYLFGVIPKLRSAHRRNPASAQVKTRPSLVRRTGSRYRCDVSVGGDHMMPKLRISASVAKDTKGDDCGFRDYVSARSPALLRTAYLLTGNRADAEDLLQAA